MSTALEMNLCSPVTEVGSAGPVLALFTEFSKPHYSRIFSSKRFVAPSFTCVYNGTIELTVRMP